MRSSATPPSRQSVGADEVRLKKALASPPSPPPSDPSDSPASPKSPHSTMPILATPPRRSSFNSTRIEFQTPSPPKGLPDLPGPPSSSSEDEDGVEEAKNAHTRLVVDSMAMRTPRPPGAWSSTPVPSQQNTRETLLRSQSVSSEQELNNTQYNSGLATPVASLSKASPLPLVTPAPPGAWKNTPGLKKSNQKVRFDPQHLESEMSASEDPELARGLSTTPVDVSDERDRDPPVTPSRSPRKPTGPRVVDAFGQTISDEGMKKRTSPRSKGTPMRIVDAMGRVLEDVAEPVSAASLKHKEVLGLVRQGLSDLGQSFDEADRYLHQSYLSRCRLMAVVTRSSEMFRPDQRVVELNGHSRVARDAREEISKKTVEVESGLRRKFTPMRASMKESKLGVSGQ